VTVRVEIVTGLERFAALQGPWRQLWERSGGYIFQSHDWIIGWLAGVRDRKDVRLRTALAWDGERLCGAIPCAVHRRSGIRVLTWVAQAFSDYCDCLVDSEYESAGLLPLLWVGLNRFGGFDLVNLLQVRPDARCRAFLEQLTRSGNRLQSGDREERCMRIENRWPDGEAFFRSLNKKARNNHTRGKRILSELGGDVSFRFVDSFEHGGALIDEIIGLKRIWLHANDPASPLLGGDSLVLRAILEKVWHSGLAKIFLLECGGRIAAGSINFVYGDRMEAYFTAYDPAFERASPGTLLIVDYARWSFDRGLALVDFLRGEEAFKFRMANAATVLSGFSGARTFMGQVAVSGHRWLSRRRQQRQEAVGAGIREELETVD
jgi:CelD/BcsL family acetyltransferase involved in cellulose biosynthesis